MTMLVRLSIPDKKQGSSKQKIWWLIPSTITYDVEKNSASLEKDKEELHASISTPSVLDNGPQQIAALAEQVKELKDTVNILISQIQMLRSGVKKTK
jgi:hypothetical protein